MKKNPSKHIKVAGQIEADFTGFNGGGLPSLSELSRLYRASPVTLRKSLALLEKKGLLDTQRGRRSRILRDGKDLTSTAAKKLSDQLQKDIEDGKLRSGHSIPKLDALVLKHHVSKATACQALIELERRGLCHRAGAKRIAGKKPVTHTTTKKLHQIPTIIILTRTHSTFTHLFRSERTIDFMMEFNTEMEKNGFRLLMALWKDPDSKEVDSGMGLMPLGKLIALLGKSYAGCAIFGGTIGERLLGEFAGTATTYQKPVIHLVLKDPGPVVVIPERKNKYYHRCTFNEWSAVLLALKTLAELGHRSICIPNIYTEYHGWVEERIRKAAYLNKKLKLGLNIINGNDTDVMGSLNMPATGLSQWIKKSTTSHPDLKKILQKAVNNREFVSHLPGMFALAVMSILEKEASFNAVLAPNDQVAEGVYRWIRYAGKKLPDDISVLSFDNNYKYRFLPISTVDFGMKYTGYAAAQIFLRQVNVPVYKDGTLKPRCHIVHRGSLVGN